MMVMFLTVLVYAVVLLLKMSVVFAMAQVQQITLIVMVTV